MNPIRRYPLRKIAENQLATHFGDLDADIRNALATSLVRQWLTYDGYAGLVTATHHHLFQLVTKNGGELEVRFDTAEGNWSHVLSHDWHVDEAKIPAFLHRLNLCQSAQCQNADGRTICLRIEPQERTVRCQEQADEGVVRMVTPIRNHLRFYTTHRLFRFRTRHATQMDSFLNLISILEIDL